MKQANHFFQADWVNLFRSVDEGCINAFNTIMMGKNNQHLQILQTFLMQSSHQSNPTNLIFKLQNLSRIQRVPEVNPQAHTVECNFCQARSDIWEALFGRLATLKHLRKIKIQKCYVAVRDISTLKYAGSISKLQQIRSLHIHSHFREHEVGETLKAISQLSNLEELVFNNYDIGDQIQAFGNLLKLRRLNLNDCSIKDTNLKFLPSLSNLMSLDLVGPKNVRVLTQLKNLQELSLSSFKYGEEEMKQLANLKKLTKLHLHGDFKSKDWFFRICQMHNLTDLLIKVENQSNITQVEFLEKLQKLKKLSMNLQINKIAVRAIASLTELIELNLRNKLQEVNKYDCFDLSRTKNLRVLKLTTGINYSSLEYLAQINTLEEFRLRNFRSSKQIGPIGARHLMKLQNLRILDLNGSNIGDEGMAYVCRIPNLSVLQVAENKIGNQGITEAQKLTKLQKLNIGQCQTNKLGESFLMKMKHLQCLQITVFKFPHKSIEVIKKYLPKVKIQKYQRRSID